MLVFSQIIQNAVFQRLSQCEIITMADRDISADESVLLHGADQRLYDLFCTARFAFKAIFPSSLPLPMPRAERLGEHTRQTWMRPFLIRLSNEESAKRILFSAENLWHAPQYRQRKGPDGSGARSLTSSRTSGPVDKESRMTIFLSGSFSSAIALAARALFMLPDSCEEW